MKAKKVKYVIFSIATLLAVFLIIEVALRLTLGNNDLGKLLYYQHDSLPCTRLKPGTEVIHSGVFKKIRPQVHKINQYGYRGKPRGPKKSKDVFRIIIVGDSFTFCPGVPEGADYPARIENHLHQSKGGNVEVLNFGVPSHNLLEVQAHGDETIEFQPDLVVFQIAQNDFSPTMCALLGEQSKFRHWLLYNSYLFRLGFGFYLISTQDYEISNDIRMSKLEQFATDVAAFRKRHGIDAAVTSFDEPVQCEQMTAKGCLGPIFNKYFIPYVIFPENLRSYLNLDVGHLNEEGSDLYAAFLADWLRNQFPINDLAVDGDN